MAETHSLQDLRQAAVASKVFVQRDYTSGTICKFQTKFPAELESRIDKQQFEETIQTLNNLYAEAEKLGGRSYLEGCLACLTAYTIFLCMETHYEKVLKKITKYIQEQNEKIYAPLGLLLTDPIERGLRVVEITIFEDRTNGGRISTASKYLRTLCFTSRSLLQAPPASDQTAHASMQPAPSPEEVNLPGTPLQVDPPKPLAVPPRPTPAPDESFSLRCSQVSPLKPLVVPPSPSLGPDEVVVLQRSSTQVSPPNLVKPQVSTSSLFEPPPQLMLTDIEDEENEYVK
ncbi:hypothetical protein Q8A67_023817 [Cirrhinus molitorella]|uniref:Golgin subfamily A member 7 n=1 Tax=Cirrhinus molitorella TaxID=172907 RepID=A0AA88P6G7_9TELE|nr:hypothetical protein Q8A67_023817 [Cirrhinus molitorella]